jgi:hypothetical protein
VEIHVYNLIFSYRLVSDVVATDTRLLPGSLCYTPRVLPTFRHPFSPLSLLQSWCPINHSLEKTFHHQPRDINLVLCSSCEITCAETLCSRFCCNYFFDATIPLLPCFFAIYSVVTIALNGWKIYHYIPSKLPVITDTLEAKLTRRKFSNCKDISLRSYVCEMLDSLAPHLISN